MLIWLLTSVLGEIGLFQNNDKFKVDEIASLRVVLARINQKGVLGDDKVRAAVISATDLKTMPMYC